MINKGNKSLDPSNHPALASVLNLRSAAAHEGCRDLINRIKEKLQTEPSVNLRADQYQRLEEDNWLETLKNDHRVEPDPDWGKAKSGYYMRYIVTKKQ